VKHVRVKVPHWGLVTHDRKDSWVFLSHAISRAFRRGSKMAQGMAETNVVNARSFLFFEQDDVDFVDQLGCLEAVTLLLEQAQCLEQGERFH